ncbi:hypothetical protein GCM10010195_04130 [Kitasatospora griseola]|nr:hypothetical protein GCM10010195_04130 [Kitasatospora griseola]
MFGAQGLGDILRRDLDAFREDFITDRDAERYHLEAVPVHRFSGQIRGGIRDKCEVAEHEPEVTLRRARMTVPVLWRFDLHNGG